MRPWSAAGPQSHPLHPSSSRQCSLFPLPPPLLIAPVFSLLSDRSDLRTPTLGDRPAQTGHWAGVRALAWSPQQPDVLASGGDDHTVRLWSLRTGSSLAAWGGDVERPGWTAGPGWAPPGGEVGRGRRGLLDSVVALAFAGGGYEPATAEADDCTGSLLAAAADGAIYALRAFPPAALATPPTPIRPLHDELLRPPQPYSVPRPSRLSLPCPGLVAHPAPGIHMRGQGRRRGCWRASPRPGWPARPGSGRSDFSICGTWMGPPFVAADGSLRLMWRCWSARPAGR